MTTGAPHSASHTGRAASGVTSGDYPRDIRFEHGDTNYDFAAYVLLALTTLVGTALVWATWRVMKHLWGWPRS